MVIAAPVTMRFRTLRSLFGEAFTGWREHKASRMAAALAYYTVFSLAPILVISIAVAGLVFGQEAAEGRIVGQVSGLIGAKSASSPSRWCSGSASSSWSRWW
jgi:membrane protein